MMFGRNLRAGRACTAGLTLIAAFSAALSGCSSGEKTGALNSGASGGGGVIVPSGPGVPSVQKPPINALADVGDIVGQFELTAPTVAEFTLHGTLPVPRGTFVPGSGTEPFVLVDAAGDVTPAQVESVTRYPSAADGADVVEVIARVARPATAVGGQMVRYDVRYQPHPTASMTPTPPVQDLLAHERGVVLRTKDVFGHAYSADLFHDARENGPSLRTLKNGRFEKQIATHHVMRPTDPLEGPQGTLKHHLGVHAYATTYASEDFVSLDLRVHNAFSGLDATTTDDDPLGKVYFESLELVVPMGWTLISSLQDPYLGTPYDEAGMRVYPIVRRIDGSGVGSLHMLPRMAQFHRRFALCREGSEAEASAAVMQEGLAFSRSGINADGREWFSWWNKNTGRWFSQRHVLPSLAPADETQVRGDLSGRMATMRDQIATGSVGEFPVENANMGWAHPWGTSAGGMVSGSEIYLYDGVDVAWSASRDGYRLSEITHRMYTDRQPNVLFNRDGTHTQEHQWVVATPSGDTMPIWWYNEPMFWAADPFGYGQAPTFQVEAVAASGRKPWYEDQLASFQAIDTQHLIRYTRSAKTLLWLGNDALAKEDLRAQAEGFRFSYTMLPQDIWGGIIPTGLLAVKNYTTAHPNNGIPFGRSEGWGLDVALVAYSTGDDAWRARQLPWLEAILGVLEKGQTSCSNVIHSVPLYNVFGAKYRCRQSIEAAIVENSLVGLRETAFLGRDPARTVLLDNILRRELYSMVSPLVWSTTHHGPWAMIAVGPFDMAQAPYCSWIPSDGNYGIPDHYQIWSSFAYGWELTHDPIFLTKAAEAMGTTDFVTGGQAYPLYNWQNRAALMALAQNMATEAP
ncbi:MAG: hypothetical protein JNL28_02740 [Planctomycetes bacterium]|nr:hypothetical protein [Planctomycetota bacterium]